MNGALYEWSFRYESEFGLLMDLYMNGGLDMNLNLDYEWTFI